LATIEELKVATEEYGIDTILIDLGCQEVSRKGDNVYCCCPMHENSDNPTSFLFKNGFGYCYTVCNRKYDIFNIVQKMKSCSFAEAVDYLSAKVGLEIEYQVLSDYGGNENREFLKSLKKLKKPSSDVKFLDKSLLEEFIPSLHTSLRKAGYNDKTKDYFNLRYAMNGFFSNRIIIPVYDIDENLITIAGRSTINDDKEKYKFLPDTDKNATLYNINNAMTYVEILREVFLVEGYKSVWRLYQWGYGNVVACMGSKVSDEQKKLLLSMASKIYVIGDYDSAGIELNKSVKRILGKYCDVEVIDLGLVGGLPVKSSPADITKEQFEILLDKVR